MCFHNILWRWRNINPISQVRNSDREGLWLNAWFWIPDSQSSALILLYHFPCSKTKSEGHHYNPQMKFGAGAESSFLYNVQGRALDRAWTSRPSLLTLIHPPKQPIPVQGEPLDTCAKGGQIEAKETELFQVFSGYSLCTVSSLRPPSFCFWWTVTWSWGAIHAMKVKYFELCNLF